MDTPNYIKHARAQLGMTIEEFATAAGISHVTVRNLEHGTTKPQAAVVGKVERLLRAHGVMGMSWTSDEAELLARFREFRADERAAVLAVVRAISAARAERESA